MGKGENTMHSKKMFFERKTYTLLEKYVAIMSAEAKIYSLFCKLYTYKM
jgi:hypothetical protein